jgi:hypothetical protein
MMKSQQRLEFMLLPAAVHEPNARPAETHAWFLQGKGIFTGAFLSSRNPSERVGTSSTGMAPCLGEG